MRETGGMGSVVTWRRARVVPLSAPGTAPGKIARVTFTSADRVRDVIRDFNEDGFASLYPRYSWKAPADPGYEAKKARVEHLYAIADGEVAPEPGEPQVIWPMDESGPLNLQPRPGRQWTARGGNTRARTGNPARGCGPHTTVTTGPGTCSPRAT